MSNSRNSRTTHCFTKGNDTKATRRELLDLGGLVEPGELTLVLVGGRWARTLVLRCCDRQKQG